MGDLGKVVFLWSFFCTMEILIHKIHDFSSNFEVPKKLWMSSITNLQRFFSWKMCIIFQHVTSKVLLFWISHFKYFLLFLTKTLFFNFFILMGKAYEINQKKYFFDILKYWWFRWNSWQKVFFIFISFTIVNPKSIVLTTVNNYCFSKVLPLIMVYSQTVQFFVCFTIVIF